MNDLNKVNDMSLGVRVDIISEKQLVIIHVRVCEISEKWRDKRIRV